MKNIFRSFAKDESGATAIEYALISGLIAVVLIAAMKNVGTTLSATFGKIAGNAGI